MATSRRITVSVPDILLQEVDGLVAMERSQRNALILEAVRFYVDERKKRDIRDQLMRGYLEMAGLNLSLAEEGPVFEIGSTSRSRSGGHE